MDATFAERAAAARERIRATTNVTDPPPPVDAHATDAPFQEDRGRSESTGHSATDHASEERQPFTDRGSPMNMAGEVAAGRALARAIAAARPQAAVRYNHRAPRDQRRVSLIPAGRLMVQGLADGDTRGGWLDASVAVALPGTVTGRILHDRPNTMILLVIWPQLRRQLRRDEADAYATWMLRYLPGATGIRAALVKEQTNACALTVQFSPAKVLPASAQSAPTLARLLWPQTSRKVLSEVGLTASENATRQNGTKFVRRACPTVVDVIDSEDGPVAVVKPLPGQSLSTYERALPALRIQLALPSLRLSLDDSGTKVLLHAQTTSRSWPQIVTPEPDSMLRARTAPDAIAGYPLLAVPVGRTIDGDDIIAKPIEFMHALVAGGSGSGKTRTILSWLSILMVGGADIVVADGKGETDFEPLFAARTPGMRMLARTTAEILRAIAWVHDETRSRQSRARLMRQHNVRGVAERPLLFIFDEFAAFKADARQRFQKDAAEMEMMVANVLRLGRSQRVHVVFATQSVYNDSFPQSWMANIKLRIWLGTAGTPRDMRNFAGGESGGQIALDAASRITPDQRGRGIIMCTKDGDAEARSVTMFQAPYAYTPDWDPVKESPSTQTLKAWEAFRREWEQVPRFSPRIAVDFRATGGVEADGNYVKTKSDGVVQPSTAPGGDETDWTQWSLRELRQLPVVALDSADGALPQYSHLDPTSPHYAGDTSGVSPAHSNPHWTTEEASHGTP